MKPKRRILKLKAILPYKNNAKIHSPEQIQQIKKSIEDNGYIQPIVLDGKNTIVMGHGRYEALKLLYKPDYNIEIVDVSHLPDKQIKKLRILDNKIVSQDYDFDILEAEIKSIYGEDADSFEKILSETGIAHDEIDAMFAGDTNEEDDILPVKVIPVTKVGDLWELNNHRILCGDARFFKDIDLLMDGKKANMAFTDPPYLMNFTGSHHADGSKSFNAKHGKLKNDKMSRVDGDLFVYKIVQAIKNNTTGAFYICFNRLGMDYVYRALEKNDLTCRALIIWEKGNHTLSNSDYMSRYEVIFYGWIKEHKFYGGDNGVDVWNIARTQKNDLHPTMKPIELMAQAIKNSSMIGDIVMDLFLGSGSTLIAAEKNNRLCYGMELDPHFCDVTRDRFIEYCEKKSIEYIIKLNGKPWSAK